MTNTQATHDGDDTHSDMTSARVALNPMGPHPYVVNGTYDGDEPVGLGDALHGATFDALTQRFGDLHNVDWITHVEPHQEFATAYWDMSADNPYQTVEVVVDDTARSNADWYTQDANDYPYY